MKRRCEHNGRIFHSSKILTLSYKIYANCFKSLSLCFKLSANRSKLFTLCSTLFVFCFILCWILYPDMANCGPYLDSAHGNTNYGVKRNTTGFPTDYTRGLCAHCHEQHASIGGAEPIPTGGPDKYELFRRLFADQSEVFCYACHRHNPAPMQENMPYQYSYSNMAGGNTTIICPQSIAQVFRFVDDNGIPQNNGCGSTTGSAHFLKNIRTFLRNQNWGFGNTIGNIDPCSGCHNPHRAQRDPHTTTGRIDLLTGKLVSSISKPSQHNNLMSWELWGDDGTERMDKYNYQPPCRYPHNSLLSTCESGYEPDGYSTSVASRTVDYVSFCTKCHNTEPNQPWSDRLGRNLRPINWSGDIHGAAFPQTCCDYGDKKAPYNEGVNYVLSCLDCHEPHGSPNEYLLRADVNGSQVATITRSGNWWYFCTACHKNLKNYPNPEDSTKHFGGIPPIGPFANCIGCHFHSATYTSIVLIRCHGCPSQIRTF